MEDNLLKEIAAYYSRTGNLGDTAGEFQISTQKCRKLLITAEVYESRSRTINEILDLNKEGMSIGQIAKIVGCTKRYVQTVLPYQKCIYNLEEKSENAKRIQRCRQKKTYKQ